MNTSFYKLYACLALAFLFFIATLSLSAETCTDANCTHEHEQTCADAACTDDHCTDAACTEDHCTCESCTDAHCTDEHCTDEHCADEHCTDACGCSEHEHEHAEPIISESALKNYGVTFGAVAYDTFTPFVRIPCRVENPAQNDAVLAMALPGKVVSIDVQAGEQVAPHSTLVTILRDPIAWPELRFCGATLGVNVQELRQAQQTYAQEALALEKAQRDLERIQTKDAAAFVTKQELADAQSAAQAARKRLETAAALLAGYGYDPAELSDPAKLTMMPNAAHWVRALKNNGFWDARTTRVYEALDQTMRENFRVIAGLGELKAMGLFTAEVEALFLENEAIREAAADALALLIQGYAPEALHDYAHDGWLSRPTRVHACFAEERDESVDVKTIDARVGAYYEAGAVLMTVSYPQRMNFVCRPAGSERALLNRAFANGQELHAEPVLKGNGLRFEKLKIASFVPDENGDVAIIPVDNQRLSGTAQNRAWALRVGMDYMLEVPAQAVMEKVIIVPPEAVTDLGSDKVVIVKHGDHYEQRRVIVLYQDAARAVLSAESDLKENEQFARSGAFRLNLALQKANGQQTYDAHAGCSH